MMGQQGMSTLLSVLAGRSPKPPRRCNAIDARFALIGGLALASYRVVRATQDVDLLADAENRPARSTASLPSWATAACTAAPRRRMDARGDERIDLLYASRPAARRLLQGAAAARDFSGRASGRERGRPDRVQAAGAGERSAVARRISRTSALCCAPTRRSWDMEEVRAYFRLFLAASRCSMNSCAKSAEAPLCAEGGLRRAGCASRTTPTERSTT